MKKNKIFLTVLGLVALAGSTFALKSSKFIAANIYYKDASNVYHLISCASSGAVRCSPQSVPVNTPDPYYSYTIGVGYTFLAEGTPLWRPQ